MASSHVYDSIKAALVAEFSGAYQVVDFDQVDQALGQGEVAFMALEDISGDAELTGFGDPSSLCVTESSFLVVHCFTPSPHSSDAARAIGDAVGAALRLKTFSGVHVRAVAPPDIGRTNDGLWTTADALLDVEHDTFVDVTT